MNDMKQILQCLLQEQNKSEEEKSGEENIQIDCRVD